MKEKPYPCLRNVGVAASCAPRPGTCDLWQGEDSGLASASCHVEAVSGWDANEVGSESNVGESLEDMLGEMTPLRKTRH